MPLLLDKKSGRCGVSPLERVAENAKRLEAGKGFLCAVKTVLFSVAERLKLLVYFISTVVRSAVRLKSRKRNLNIASTE